MELPRNGEYRYTLHIVPIKGRQAFFAYILQIKQPADDIERPRFCNRFTLNGEFKSKDDACREGIKTVQRIADGLLSPESVRLKEKFRDYKIIGSARLRLDQIMWEPTLEIVSQRPANKGAVQCFNDYPSSFQRNLFDDVHTAADYAMNHGKRLIVGLVGGLKI